MSKTSLHILAVAMVVLVTLAPNGFAQTITTFDPTGSTGTVPRAINPAGQITGFYYGGGGVHGFLRNTDGTITTFDITGATYTFATAINPTSKITGWYEEANY